MRTTPQDRHHQIAGAPTDFLGCGEMGKLVRAMDWSQSPLGAIDSWPQSLKTATSLCLASTFPISIAWGHKRIQIYNDGYWPICGAKHPHSMGQDFRECWASAWPVIGEAFESALSGHSAYLENQRIFIDRYGYLEETFFTFSFSPIRDESGGVGGLFHPVTEVTAKLLSERRTRALRDLAERTGKAKMVEDVFGLAARSLAENELDVPFLLLYAVEADGHQARLRASTGLSEQAPLRAEAVPLGDAAAAWLLTDIARRDVSLDVGRFGGTACKPYPEPPKQAVVLPLMPVGSERPLGWAVVGISPRLAFNEAYQSFVELIGSAVTSALTNARAYEEERRRAEALAEIDRAKTAFFSNVSHEFRTPLTLMLGPVEDALADPDGALSPIQRGRLEVAHRNSLRLLKLVNTLLDFSRIEAGRVQARFELTDLAKVTAEMASHFHSACDKAGVRLVVDCPPLDQPVHVDRDMWEKVVLNLLSNAFKFTLEGEIAVRLRAGDGVAELTVIDTGTGIPAGEMPRLFERFHRIEGTQGRTYEGTGIGLALVQELVRLHCGAIWAESELGRGTTFHVTVPLGTAHLPSGYTPPPAQSPTTARAEAFIEESLRWLPESGAGSSHRADEGSHGPMPGVDLGAGRPRVLIADDNQDMRDYVRRILVHAGCDVTAVGDGEAALAAILVGMAPNLVLSDVMMPRLDGFALLRKLRASPRTEGIPVILLSARAGEEARVEGLSAGADDYLVKPFSARELVARVEGSLRLAKMRREKAAAERMLLERALGLSQDRLSLALDSAHMGMWDWDILGDELTWSPVCKAIFGKAPDAPMSYGIFLDSLHPDDRERVDALCHQCLDPSIRAPYDTQYRTVWPDGSIHWVLARGRVYFDGGRAARFIGTAVDITDDKDAEVHLRLMVDELSHRVKNTLAVIQSIAEQTFRSGRDTAGIRRALAGRLQALADTHTLLTQSAWESVDLATLAGRAIEHLAKDGDHFRMTGPNIQLTPKASLALGLVLHELATNAVKYGAWAVDGGSVTLTWKATGQDLALEWTETGMRGTAVPSRNGGGFGTRLIDQAVEYDLGGEVERSYGSEGLHCLITAPLGRSVSARS